MLISCQKRNFNSFTPRVSGKFNPLTVAIHLIPKVIVADIHAKSSGLIGNAMEWEKTLQIYINQVDEFETIPRTFHVCLPQHFKSTFGCTKLSNPKSSVDMFCKLSGWLFYPLAKAPGLGHIDVPLMYENLIIMIFLCFTILFNYPIHMHEHHHSIDRERF